MWSTIVSFVFKAVDTTYFKIAWIAALCFCVGSLTYSYQSHKYEAQIADLRVQMALAVAQQEKANAEKLSKAIEERDSANSRLSALSASNASLLDRLRKSGGGSATGKDTGAKDTAGESLARCNRLLREGADLVTLACERWGRCAADKDALVEIVK